MGLDRTTLFGYCAVLIQKHFNPQLPGPFRVPLLLVRLHTTLFYCVLNALVEKVGILFSPIISALYSAKMWAGPTINKIELVVIHTSWEKQVASRIIL